MNVIVFGILGFGLGAAYTLLAQGLVIIYRGSGVLNFAQGAYATAGAYLYVELHYQHGQSFAVSFIAAVLAAAILGALTHLLIMRPLRAASSLVRVIATLGVLSIITGAATIRYGDTLTLVPPSLPQSDIHVGGAAIPVDQLWLLAIATVLSAVLWAVNRFTTIGLAVTAAAQNRLAASSLGWSPDLFATVTWAIGGALAAVAGVLIAPLSGLNVTNLTLFVIAAMAAALFGDFTSYPRVWAAAVVIGIGESEMNSYVQQPGWSTALPFLLIMLVIVIRGRGIPLRSQLFDRLPRLGSGIPNVPVILAVCVVLAVGMLTFFSEGLAVAVGVQATAGILIASIVVLTGYAGQLSLGQFALAGMGAFVAGRLVASAHIPFTIALFIGVLVSVPIGLLFALPALRTRGINLAVVTLGLGVSVDAIIFENQNYTGGIVGTNVGPAHFLGIDLDPIIYPARYGLFCLVWFVLVILVVANIRRGRVGRRLIAIRANERAAAALGISPFGSKFYAFGLSSAIAGLGGILLAFQSYAIVFSGSYTPLMSVNLVGDAVIGGLGYATGPIAGSVLYAGGIPAYVLFQFGSIEQWLLLVGGVGLVITVLLNPDGIVGQLTSGNAKVDPLTALLLRRARARQARRAAASLAAAAKARASRAADAGSASRRVTAASVGVEDLTVRFGGVVALSDVSLRVASGEVVGLIGPNGGGKTTMIDVISGFTRPASGTVLLNGTTVNALSAYQRARAGIGRSWQSLELFEDMTVFENLQSASDPRDQGAYFSNLVGSSKSELAPAAAAAVQEFRLGPYLMEYPGSLSNGNRRLVGIARAVAAEPSILLLDEPASGLNDVETRELSLMVRRLADNWGMGILLVEHDMDIVMTICDRVTVLDFGRKIAEGPPETLRRDPAVIAAYLGQPA